MKNYKHKPGGAAGYEAVQSIASSQSSHGNLQQCTYCGIQFGSSSDKYRVITWPTIPLRESKTYVLTKTYTQMFTIELFIIDTKGK